jgi:hypothetical protein
MIEVKKTLNISADTYSTKIFVLPIKWSHFRADLIWPELYSLEKLLNIRSSNLGLDSESAPDSPKSLDTRVSDPHWSQ